MTDDGESLPEADLSGSIVPDGIATPVDGPESESSTLSLSAFIGPMPHPDLLERYEKILPGFSDRSLSLLEKEQVNRNNIDRRSLDLSSKHMDHVTRRFLVLRVSNVLVLTILGLLGAAVAFWAGGPTIGGSVLVVEAAGILLNTLVSNFKPEGPEEKSEDE